MAFRSWPKTGRKERHPHAFGRKTYQRAAAEVYAYGGRNWAKLFKKSFSKQVWTLDEIKQKRDKRKEGKENDGLDYNKRKYGKGGEGKHHKALRLWVEANPGAIRRGFADASTDTEVDLLSGDRVGRRFIAAKRRQ